MVRVLVIVTYFAILLLLGGVATAFLKKNNNKDYLLASHSIGPFLLLMSLFGTTMTSFAMVGSSGEAFVSGIGVYGKLASISGLIHSLCFFVIGTRVWKYGKKFGHTTQVDFFRDRLESPRIGLFLFPVLLLLLIPYILGGVIGSGTIIQSLTAGAFPDWFPHKQPALAGGIPSYLGSLVVCAVVLIYVFFGGMRGTAWANCFQTIVFMVLGVLTFYLIAIKLGGSNNLLTAMQNAIKDVPATRTSRSEMSHSLFIAYMLVPLSVGTFPHLFQHWLTAKNAAAFKLPIIMHPFFIMIVWVPCIMVGVWAAAPGVLPAEWYANPSENQNKVLGYLVTKHTTPVVGGLLAAGVLAAIMSSLDSQFLCVGTMFTNDIYRRFIRKPNANSHSLHATSGEPSVWVARTFIILIVAISYVLGIVLEGRSIFALSIWCFSGYAGLFPIIFAALYWRGLTATGAQAATVTMIVTWCYFFYAGGEELLIPGTDWDILPVVPITLGTTVVMIVVSLVTKKPTEKTLSRYFEA
ncbi:MAG: sodium:solute symporter family protein [Planctomycetaceae bacterium]|nr:sodium:solute symporter family protein [Planctomycetaceae bacterium]